MGARGTQAAAIEVADVALMTDDLSKIVLARFVGVGVVHVLGITAALLGWIGPIQAAMIHPGPDELDNKIGKVESHGSFTAPSTGVHGWFWENKGDRNVEMHLTVAGFFDAAKMYAGGPPEDLPVEDAK